MNKIFDQLKNTIFSYQYWHLAFTIVARNLKEEFGLSYLGNLWLLIRPLVLIIVLSAVLSRITRFPEQENYVFFLTTNLVHWLFIANIMSVSTVSLIQRAGILKLCPVPKTIFIMSDLLKFSKIYLVSLVALYIAVGFFTQVEFHYTAFLFPVYLIILILMLFFIAIILAYITPYVRDVKTLVEALMPAFMWLTPVMYPVNILDSDIASIIQYSPFSIMIAPFTKILYYGQIPDTFDHTALAVLFLFLLILAWITHRRLSKNVIYYL